MLKIYIDKDIDKSKEIIKVFNHIFDVIGYKFMYTEIPSESNVIYCSNVGHLTEKKLFFYFDKKLHGKDLNNQHFENFDYHNEDCIYKASYLLQRNWEKDSDKDIVGVVKVYENSNLLFLKKAYVAELIQKIILEAKKLFSFESIPLWPNNRKFCLVMSHDVDEPYKTYQFSYLKDELKWKYKNCASKTSLLKTTIKIFNSLIKANIPDKNFGFDFWYDLESQLKGNSVFYVSVINSFQKYAHILDVPYDYYGRNFKKKLNFLIDNGWEVGLHASINAYKNPERFISEKWKLESVLNGYKVKGIRHHYWSLGNEIEITHQNHLEAGFEYDSSLGLNDIIGFRSGTIWPYELISNSKFECNSFFQIPPTIMDGNIFYYNDQYLNYYQKLKNHFEYVENLNGCVVLDWHLEQSNFTRLNGAGQLLKNYLLSEILQKDVFITSPIKLLDWWKLRKKLIENLE